MKLTRDAPPAGLLQRTPGLRLVLLHGPDGGLARERAKAWVIAVAGDAADPFRVAELPAATFKEVPSRLADEAAALSFTGGRRVVWIRDATDAACGTQVQSFLADLPGEALVVVEAGELTPKSGLRKAAEASDRALSIGCYHDDGRDLGEVVRTTLERCGLTVAPEALRYLTEHMGSDRMVSRGELEKLALYVGDGGRVELADAIASIGDTAAASLDEVLAATADGRPADLDRALVRAYLDGESPVGIVRAALRHFQKLHLVAGQTATGMPVGAAVAALRPPPFKRDADRLAQQASRWPLARADAALRRLLDAEVQCKTTALPDETMCARALLDLAELARRAAAR